MRTFRIKFIRSYRHFKVIFTTLTLILAGFLIIQMNQLLIQNRNVTRITFLENNPQNNLSANSNLYAVKKIGSKQEITFIKLMTNELLLVSENGKLFFSSEELIKNISRVPQSADLYVSINDDRYLRAHENYFKTKAHVNNNFSPQFLINGENICSGNAPFILVLFPSVASHVEMRMAIRETWLSAAEGNNWPSTEVRGLIKHVFLFGCQNKSLAQDLEQLRNESESYNDIVMADFQDSYRNLTTKMLVGFNWTLKYCNKAQLILKVDEDTFINVPLMVELLLSAVHTTSNAGIRAFVLGMQHSNSKPKVVRDGEWAVSDLEYPLPYYPRYVFGHTYAISIEGVNELYKTAEHVTLIAPEDAFLTGMLPKIANVSRFSAPSFTVCCRPIYDCEVVWNKRVALTSVNSVFLLRNLWSSVLSHTCNPTHPFSNWP